jgi:hypothetical protein
MIDVENQPLGIGDRVTARRAHSRCRSKLILRAADVRLPDRDDANIGRCGFLFLAEEMGK